MEKIKKKYRSLLKNQYNLNKVTITIDEDEHQKNFQQDIDITIDIHKNDETAEISITQFPGCCGIAVVNTLKNYGKSLPNIGKILFDMCVEICKEEGYGYIMFTDKANDYGDYFTAKYKEYNIRLFDEFKNPNSSNKVKIWSLNLKM